jgi:hypothetical protein
MDIKYGINNNKFNIGQGIGIFTTTATATTIATNNNNIRNNIYFFRFSDGEGKT